MTNSIKNDMANESQYVNGLALCALGNIGSNEMCRALAREVENMMLSANCWYKQGTLFCAVLCGRHILESWACIHDHVLQVYRGISQVWICLAMGKCWDACHGRHGIPRMASGNPYVRKKAALCAMRIVRKVEEIEDKFNNKIGNLLEDSFCAALV